MKNFNIIAAAVAGHVLEFYDFTVYAVFSIKIGQLFFPNTSPFTQLLSSLAIFAVGFFMRPIGGAVFGHMGDRYGRRLALTVSVVLMAISTASIGLMPDYNSIGMAAPILLVCLRLVQGLCVGGEGAGASIFILEHLHQIKPGLIGGIVNAALTLGILLAIFAGITLNNIFGVDSDAWRYAFVLGGIFGIVGLYIRLKVDETPVFKQLQAENKVSEAPIMDAIKTSRKSILLTVAAGALTSTNAYCIMTFLNIFLHKVMDYDTNTALYYSAFGNLSLVILLPILGMLSDKIGYGRTMAFSCLLILLVSVPVYQMIASGETITTLIGITCLATLIAANYAPLYPFMFDLFPPHQRYSGIACSLNLGIALFGGTSPMISIYMIEHSGLLYSAAFSMDFVCLLFLVSLYMIRRDKFLEYFYCNKVKAASLADCGVE